MHSNKYQVKPSDHAEALVRFLSELRAEEDRGSLAALRRALGSNPASHARAWRMLAPYGGCPDEALPWNLHRANVVRTVAGIFSLPNLFHSDQSPNFGKTCQKLMDDPENKKPNSHREVDPVSRRILHLLAASKEEVCSRVIPFALRLSQKDGVHLNFKKLHDDLIYWDSSHKKMEWASGFWGAVNDEESQPEEEEAP